MEKRKKRYLTHYFYIPLASNQFGDLMDVGQVVNYAWNSLVSPTKTAKGLTKMKLSLMDGAVAVILGALVPAVIAAIGILLFAAIWGGMMAMVPVAGPMMAALGAGVGITLAIAVLVIFPIGALIGWVIGSVIVWVIASILGGKGDVARFMAVFAFPTAAIMALSWIPVLNILLGLYALYLLYVFLQPTMSMDSNKAAITVIVLVILAIVLGFAGGWSMRPW